MKTSEKHRTSGALAQVLSPALPLPADNQCCYLVSAAGFTGPVAVATPPGLTVNNNARQLLQQHFRRRHSRGNAADHRVRVPMEGRPLKPRQQQQQQVMITFAEYARLMQQAGIQVSVNNAAQNQPNALSVATVSGHRVSGVLVNQSAADAMDANRQRQSMFHRPQLSTFAEYQERSLVNAESVNRRTSDAPSLKGTDRSSGMAQVEVPGPEESEAVAAADNEEEQDAATADTAAKGSPSCCACCSRGRRDRPDPTSRRKRRLVGNDGAATGAPNRAMSMTLEDDADLVDVKDMDPTITLMPYVLFDSERAKVLYQSVNMDEAELLKRAIALHANDLYKKVLMRLHMYRYLKSFRESVVRAVLSKKIQLGQNDALAANVLGIDSEDVKSSGASSSAAMSVGLTFDSHPVEMLSTKRSIVQLAESPDVSRQMFKPAPKFSDVEILELLNGGKILDVTGRASLESLVSLPTTKVGQRRST